MPIVIDSGSSPPREHRVAFAEVFDSEARPHDESFQTAANIAPTDRVLDIGCGTGHSTRIAARAAGEGSALGVDISAALIEHARHLTAAEGLHNVTFEHADAATYQFPQAQFDVCISRFGSMFFTDPRAAFTNIARGLRPGAQLVLLVWQAQADNEWSVAIRETVPSPVDPAPFSLADPAVVRGVLEPAGFVDVGFVDVHEPVRYGPDAATAFDFVLGFRDAKTALDTLDAAAADAARTRLRDVIAEHETSGGVLFDSRAWIVTARR